MARKFQAKRMGGGGGGGAGRRREDGEDPIEDFRRREQ